MKNNKIVNLRAFYSGFMETDTVELFWSCRLIDYVTYFWLQKQLYQPLGVRCTGFARRVYGLQQLDYHNSVHIFTISCNNTGLFTGITLHNTILTFFSHTHRQLKSPSWLCSCLQSHRSKLYVAMEHILGCNRTSIVFLGLLCSFSLLSLPTLPHLIDILQWKPYLILDISHFVMSQLQ